MSDPSRSEAPGRRVAARPRRRRLDATTVASVLLPALAVVAALGVHAQADPRGSAAPVRTDLDRSTVICPSGGGASQAQVATLGEASGQVAARLGARQQQVDVRPHTPTDVAGADRPLVVTGADDLAPGLLAARFASPLAVADCRPPLSDQWFTGVGSGAKHSSVLMLVNPDAGRADVDVDVLGRNGPVDLPGLQGLAVPGGATVQVDLARVVPRRYDLALHVTTSRGRVAASLADSFDELGNGASGADWLAAQDEPSTTNTLLGLPAGDGTRVLVLANPGDDEGRATVRLVTPQSVFTPEGSHEITVAPGATVRVPLAPLLRGAGTGVDEAPIGVEVDSSVAMTVGFLAFVDGDLARGTALPSISSDASALLPEGDKTLLLAGATGPGAATVSMWDADGTALDDLRVDLGAGQGYAVRLPENARLVRVTPERTSVEADVLVTGSKGSRGSTSSKGSTSSRGIAEVMLRTPLSTGLVPSVRPGLP